MEKLLKLAAEQDYQAEIFSKTSRENGISMQNGLLQDIESNFRAGLSLRIIRDGKLGFAYTKNLKDRQTLLQDAIDSMTGGVPAPFSFPKTDGLADLDNYSSAIEEVSNTQVATEVIRVSDFLRRQTSGEVHIDAGVSTDTIRLLNTSGTDVSTRYSEYGIRAGISFPGSAAGISRYIMAKDFEKMPDEVITDVLETFAAAEPVVQPAGGNMQVMFMPGSMHTLTWRIAAGLNAKQIHEKISPLTGRLGEKIWSDKLTIYDDPTDCRFPASRPFDDEGVPCSRFSLVDQGVLTSIYADLNYAGKMNISPTGHGFRSGMWGGDATALKPIPALSRMIIQPGEQSMAEMLKQIDRGILLYGALGPHSGNIDHGDFSVGASPGLYVENGKITGQVKDAMVAGNIYEMFNNLLAVGNKLYPVHGGQSPALLFGDVSVATRG